MHVRLIGVIRATQTERRTSIRNDRLVASIETPVNKARFRELSEVPRDTVREIEHCRFCREHCAATGSDQRVGSSHAGPEPSTLAPFGVAALGLAVVRRRRVAMPS